MERPRGRPQSRAHAWCELRRTPALSVFQQAVETVPRPKDTAMQVWFASDTYACACNKDDRAAPAASQASAAGRRSRASSAPATPGWRRRARGRSLWSASQRTSSPCSTPTRPDWRFVTPRALWTCSWRSPQSVGELALVVTVGMLSFPQRRCDILCRRGCSTQCRRACVT